MPPKKTNGFSSFSNWSGQTFGILIIFPSLIITSSIFKHPSYPLNHRRNGGVLSHGAPALIQVAMDHHDDSSGNNYGFGWWVSTSNRALTIDPIFHLFPISKASKSRKTIDPKNKKHKRQHLILIIIHTSSIHHIKSMKTSSVFHGLFSLVEGWPHLPDHFQAMPLVRLKLELWRTYT